MAKPIIIQSFSLLTVILCLVAWTETGFAQRKVAPEIWEKAKAEGAIQVLVELTVPWRSDVKRHSPEMLTQNKAIADVQNQLLRELAGTHYKVISRLELIPVIALEVNFYGLTLLRNSSVVAAVTINSADRLHHLQRAPFIQ